MKRSLTIGSVILMLTVGTPGSSRAQSTADCIQQLVLDYQKLAGLKNILRQMYNGYTVISKGYNALKGVAQGNFSLQEAFLDGLYLVSPTVRQYPRIRDIINDQAQLISEYKSASTAFHRDQHFKPDELVYMMTIYNNLIGQSLKNLDALAMVVTDSQLRMNDAERLTAIDRIYLESHDRLSYLRKFNDQATRINWQRAQGAADRQSIRSIYGLTQ